MSALPATRAEIAARRQDLRSAGEVTIEVAGEPVAFARSRHNGRQHFTPTKQRTATAVLQFAATQKMGNRWPLEGQLELILRVERVIPASWSKSKRADALSGRIRPTSKPDLSNYIKLVEDALNTVVWRDDAQVVVITATKWYAAVPRTVITVKPVSLENRP